VERRARAHGWQFLLALETLQQLAPLRVSAHKGLTMPELTLLLRVDALQLVPVLETLLELDWVGLLQEEREGGDARYVLLANPDTTLMEPLFNALLLQHEFSTENLWKIGRWRSIHMRDAL
jgi:membrane protein